MLLIFAGFVGFLAALLIHGITWTMRLNQLTLTVFAGILSALALTGFCLLFLNSDIKNMMLIVLMIFWGVALVIGVLQARPLAIPWWKGLFGTFFEMGLAFVAGAGVNLTLQKYIPWLEGRFPGIDVYATINTFLWSLIITLLVLAVLRPLILLRKVRLVRE